MNLDISRGFLTPESTLPFEAEVILPPQEIRGEEIAFDPVALFGTYCVMNDDVVMVDGVLRTAAHAQCSLCLSPVTCPLEVEFSETFCRNADETVEDVFCYSGKALPLDQMTLTNCLLNLPIRFRCEGGCPDGVSISHLLGDVEERIHPEEEEQTYFPFAELGKMLGEKETEKKN